MLCVLEGPDRSGKSTLARKWSHQFGMQSRHFSKPEVHALDEYVKPLEVGAPHAVFDRYHIGERIWPEYFGRPTDYDVPMHRYVELALNSRGAVLVLTDRDPAELARVYAEENEPVLPDDVDAIRNRFAQEAQLSILPSVVVDIERSPQRALDAIGIAQQRAYRAQRISGVTPRWVGSPTADVLLVGDQVGPGSGDWSLPFVPYRRTSGHFLMSELVLDRELLSSVALVNSVQPNGEPENVLELWEELLRPKVVALGRLAERRLQRIGLEHKAVAHPQYVRRFQRANGTGYYVNAIREASAA